MGIEFQKWGWDGNKKGLPKVTQKDKMTIINIITKTITIFRLKP